ncbi:hypothetical protein M378DRAFT_154667, partial [Amanita muscaria Koide BX008]
MLKLAVNGNGLGESGNGVGREARLRINFVEAADFKLVNVAVREAAKMDGDAIFIGFKFYAFCRLDVCCLFAQRETGRLGGRCLDQQGSAPKEC